MTLATRLPRFPWDLIAPLHEKAGLHPGGPVDLSIGTPVDPVPAVIRSALAEDANAPGYPPTEGTPRLRSAAAGWLARAHGVSVSPDDVLPVLGTKEFIAWLPVLLGSGRATSSSSPELAYPTYDVGARLAGATVAAPASPPSPGPAGVKLVWVNSPSNPTGRVLSARELAAVVGMGQGARGGGRVRRVLPLARLGGSPRLGVASRRMRPVAPGRARHSFAVQAVQPGRVPRGFVTGDPALVAELLAIRKQAGMIVPRPVQAAMTAALDDDAHAAAQRERYAARRSVLRTALAAAGWTIDHSQAGLYLWAAHPAHDCWSAADVLAARNVDRGRARRILRPSRRPAHPGGPDRHR